MEEKNSRHGENRDRKGFDVTDLCICLHGVSVPVFRRLSPSLRLGLSLGGSASRSLCLEAEPPWRFPVGDWEPGMVSQSQSETGNQE
ncbi:MAG: hypothetical protein AAGA75_21210 [Cyanobacteria bacterium P01_E01_bin.6]